MTPGDLDEARPTDRTAPGAYVVGSSLFFILLDNSAISCECIAEPYASKIVELFSRGPK